MLSSLEHGGWAWHSLVTLARGGVAILLVLAGLPGISQPNSGADGKFVNLSTRALVDTGEEVMIGGFIIEDGARMVLIQALGPELANAGISNALADPILTVTNTTDAANPVELRVNDNWEDSQRQLVTDLWGGSPNLTAGSLSSAVVLTLDPGNYTAKVEGKDGATGIAIVEVYGIDSPATDGRLVNLSTRALVATGDDVLIGGFIIREGARQVLIQALGPELANAGISNALADPVLTVTKTTDAANPMELMVNDNWEDGQGQLVAELWGGNPNLTAGSLSSAAVITLDPGNYTAKIEGKDGTSGVAIVEVYAIDPAGAGSPDREALEAFYHATDGANWRRSVNWGTDAPLDQWYGVSVDEEGRVIKLEFSGNLLSGAIPAELGKLANLEVLDLSRNLLNGLIPAELGRLTSLEVLDLSHNLLSEAIPLELGNLTNLENLFLHNNWLSGAIPLAFGNLTNLESLFLHNNRLSGPIPSELGNLVNLEELRLYENQLIGSIPSELGNLSNLESLDLHDNQLSGPIPTELGNLGNLEGLFLSHNQLNGSVPSELGNLANLEAITLDGNQFSGCIPNALRDVGENDFFHFGLPYCGTISSDRAALVALYNATDGPNWDNSSNWLTDGPLGDWQGVTTDTTTGRVIGLDLSGNNLTGPIPPELGNLANLEAITLDGNQLTGCIPNWLGDLAGGDLSTLGLQYCGTISGDRAALVALYNATDGANWTIRINWLSDAPLSSWFGVNVQSNGRLEDLGLPDNQLSGPIPGDLGKLTNLEILHLHNNQLSGPIPGDLGNLANLQDLLIPDNQLSGPIPGDLGRLTNLERLHLSDNQLSGPIPVEIGNLTNLESLWLHNNQLSGAIPAELGNLANLERLDFSGNQFNGPILAELGNLANLEELRLYENQFTGPLPAELGNLAKLQHLWLWHNQLSGPIPAELGNLANLQTIYLGGNQFSGCIPKRLQDVAVGDLSTLGLAYCGTIFSDRAALVALYNATDGPNWAGNANWLTDAPLGDWEGVTTDDTTGRVVGLDLSGNNLSGPLPHELGDLGDVILVLDLSDNQLIGPMPTELGNLANLQAIYLGGNQFSGCIPSGWRGLAEGDLSTLGLTYCGTNSSDRATLVALYNATDGANWTNSDNWGTNAPLDLWYGVGIDKNGRVIELDLSGNQLTGTIPPELGNLGDVLLELYLSYNHLSGSIPAELGRLTRLERLHLSYNQLSGPIPAELGQLTNLRFLYLKENQLSGEIPAELGQLANLRELHLSDNQLTGPIPAELADLPLSVFSYSHTNLCLPANTELDAWLDEIPNHIGPRKYCADLVALTALYNATDGANWRRSDFWGTDAPLRQWYGVEIDQNGRVIELSLFGNQLSGSIPAELGLLTHLARLNLRDNRLSGPIPSELGNLARLKFLNFASNQLSGPIPPELENLANLEELWLWGNQLSGQIPPELGNLADLERLLLWDNQLSGPIPAELGRLTKLERLWLSSNQLSGPIPPEIGNLASLRFLFLDENQLSGPIPAETGNIPELIELRLYNNQLSGPIPAELGELANLRAVFLDGNQFSGCIPGGLKGVARHDFSELGLPYCQDLDVPDLVVLSPSVSPKGPNAGNSFTLSATVRNQAGGESATTTLRYYRSEDATITTSDTEVGTDAVGALAPSGTSEQSIELTAPSTAGMYFYGACVDTVPNEYDTTNNCSLWVQVEVE